MLGHSRFPHHYRRIVVSGGRGPKEDITEAEAMRRYLIEHGVNDSLIIIEDRSHSTTENFAYSKRLLDNHFAGKDYAVACITSDYHAFRARMTAKKAGLNARFTNASVKWYLRPSAYCREALSVCKFRVLGYGKEK